MAQSLRPLATVGAEVTRPISIRRSLARPVSSPPSRSSSVALKNDPMTTSVSAGWSAWPSHVPDSASRGAPTGITLVTAPASLSAAPSTASTDSSAPTAPVAKFSPRAISTSQVRGSLHSVCHVEIVHYASRMSPPATLLMWFQLRSPELAEDFERLMTEDRDVVRGSLDTVSDWRLARPADVPGQSMGQADYVLIAEIVEVERFEQQASEHVQRLADDLAHLVSNRGMLVVRTVVLYSRSGADDLAAGRQLHHPAVPVGIGEEQEPASGQVLHLARLDAALEQLGAGGVDVRHDHLDVLERARRHLCEALADRDRARRSRRRQLNETNLVADGVVVVRVESDLLCVERLRPVDVADGPGDQFELPIHALIIALREVRQELGVVPVSHSRESGVSRLQP